MASYKDVKMIIPKPERKSYGRFKKVEYVTIHNTANSASARSEARYVDTGGREASYHFAIDDLECVQVMPLELTAWHAGDYQGNVKSLGIEICYSTDHKSDKYYKAEDNAAHKAAKLLHEYGLPLDALRKHQDWSGKHCPHRILDETGWGNFKAKVKKYYDGSGTKTEKKEDDTLYKVQLGAFKDKKNAQKLEQELKKKGYDTYITTDQKEAKKPVDKPKVKIYKAGDIIRIKATAKTYATGETIPERFRGQRFHIQQLGKGKVLIQELYSWVRLDDIE